MNLDALIERLMNFFAGERFKEDLADAKREFFESAGAFDEYSTDFELKMSQFVDWYLFTRLMKTGGATPVQLALSQPEFEMTEAERPLFETLNKSRHSLFEFLKVKGEDLHVRDLIAKDKLVIPKSPVTAGFDRSEYFEGRLFETEQGLMFGRSFCFHPMDVAKFILAEVKLVQKIKDQAQKESAREALIQKLFKMKYKHEKYRHVNVREIYSNDSKLRI